MNADLESLVILQSHDLELKRLREERSDAPRRIAAAESARASAESSLAAAKAALAKEETLRRSHEVDIAAHRAKMARLTKQMETATSAAQITALEHEISFANTAISALEDEELASLERTDTHEAARALHAAQLANLTEALGAERTRGLVTVRRTDAAITALEAQRATLRAAIEAASPDATPTGAALLSTYDRVAKAKGTALSEAVNHKCSACQMLVRPQRWNDLTDRDPHSPHAATIFTCETCGRLLYYDPRRDAPTPWPPAKPSPPSEKL
jgi:predicted  nucleic acid-binding Zn-ribbon protein